MTGEVLKRLFFQADSGRVGMCRAGLQAMWHIRATYQGDTCSCMRFCTHGLAAFSTSAPVPSRPHQMSMTDARKREKEFFLSKAEYADLPNTGKGCISETKQEEQSKRACIACNRGSRFTWQLMGAMLSLTTALKHEHTSEAVAHVLAPVFPPSLCVPCLGC